MFKRPLLTTGLLLFPSLALLILNLALLSARSLKVTRANPISDFLPQFSALKLVFLVLDRGDGDFFLGRRHVRELLACLCVSGNGVPLAFKHVEWGRRVDGRFGDSSLERVCLAREVPSPRIINRREIAGGRSNVRRVSQLNVRTRDQQTSNHKPGERNQERLLPSAVREVQRENGVPDLLDDDARLAERRLLRVVALQLETLALVLDVVRGDGRVMRDLLYDELCAPAAFSIRPVSVEQLAQNGIKRLLFGTQFFIARGVLPFQRALETEGVVT